MFDRPTRRAFLSRCLAAAGALSAGGVQAVDSPPAEIRFPLIGFTKPFQNQPLSQLAETVATVGWDGIECPVRAKGQVEPEQSADELPRVVEALQQVGRQVHLVTTDITSLDQPHALTVLRTMSQLGLKRLRLGVWKYKADQSPADQLAEIAPAVKDIAAACAELNLLAGMQNHSGASYVGAPVWDIYRLIETLDPRHIGICFDIGHATVEGGLSWPVEARLMEPWYMSVIVKDFTWQKQKERWKNAWCGLGEGMVDRRFFDRLRKSPYRGPIVQHHEYELGDEREMIAHMQRDLQVLKSWLA